jgi:MFS transporter, NNP family, nitrate/nitrite transporter
MGQGRGRDGMPQTFIQSVPAISSAVFILLLITFNRVLLSPLLLQIQLDFSISHGPSSRIFLFRSIGFSSALLISMYISSRIIHRATVLLSSVLIFTALLFMAAARTLTFFNAAILAAGFGSGLYPVSGLAVLNDLVIRKDRQKAISFHELGPHTAMLLAPLLANSIIQYGSWRSAYVILAVITLAAGILYFIRVPAGSFKGDPPTYQVLGELFRIPLFWVLIMIFSIAVGAATGIYAIIPIFLVDEAGYTQEAANTLFSISRLTPIAALIGAGLVQDRVGVKWSLLVSIIGCGVMIILTGLLSGPLLLAAIFLQPAFAAVIIPPALTAAATVGGPKQQGIIIAMLLPIASVFGTGIIPSFIGYMGDAASFSLAFIIIGAVTMVSSIGVIALHHHQQL